VTPDVTQSRVIYFVCPMKFNFQRRGYLDSFGEGFVLVAFKKGLVFLTPLKQGRIVLGSDQLRVLLPPVTP
jgi:hypothetical protein